MNQTQKQVAMKISLILRCMLFLLFFFFSFLSFWFFIFRHWCVCDVYHNSWIKSCMSLWFWRGNFLKETMEIKSSSFFFCFFFKHEAPVTAFSLLIYFHYLKHCSTFYRINVKDVVRFLSYICVLNFFSLSICIFLFVMSAIFLSLNYFSLNLEVFVMWNFKNNKLALWDIIGYIDQEYYCDLLRSMIKYISMIKENYLLFWK